MGPGGESIKAFENIYAPAKGQQPQQAQQPAGQLPWKDYSGNLLDNDAWDALLSRLPAWYRPEPRQDAIEQPMAETLSGGNGTDDVELTQQEDTLQETQDRSSQAPEPNNVEPEPREEVAPDIAKESVQEIAGALGLDTKKIYFTNPDIQAALVGTHIYNQLGKQDQEKILGQIERVKPIDPQLHGKLRNAVADSRANPIWQPALLTDEQLEKHIKETETAQGWLEKIGNVSDAGKAAGKIPNANIPEPVKKANTRISLMLRVANNSFEKGLERLYEERDRRRKLND